MIEMEHEKDMGVSVPYYITVKRNCSMHVS